MIQKKPTSFSKAPYSHSKKTAYAKPFSRGPRPATSGSHPRPASGGYSSRPTTGGAPRSSYSSHSAPRPASGSYSSRPSSGGPSRGGFKPSYNGRPSSGGRPPSRFSAPKRGGNRSRGERIDYNRFINKATVVTEEMVYVPTNTFSDFLIDERIKTAITGRKYIHPSPIQDKAIPEALKGRDILGIANTGTGKTAAFLIPLIHKVLGDKTQKVLIIAPTRELAQQIEKELIAFVSGMRIYSVTCVGGSPIRPQISELRKGVDFVIGTPGRLMDLVQQKYINLAQFQNVVLDEADRMLDMGFVEDIRKLLGKMPEKSQKLFFTATLAPEIERLVNQFLHEPVKIMVKTRDTSKNIDQDVVRVPHGSEKIDHLHNLLITEGFEKVLIFAETKRSVERLTKDLISRGFKAGSIHGDKTNRERMKTLEKFKINELKVLVATDVAARGLDIPNVSHVINYEIPQTYDTYVHRIGRTGRADKKGIALTFVH